MRGWLRWVGVWLVAGVAGAGEGAVTVVYHNVCNPWKWQIAFGAFERETGYDINWRKFETGEAVVAAMSAGEVQIALMGSSTFAAGVAEGLDAQLFWVAEDIRAAEALVVDRAIAAPQDLRGKRIAAPFYTTTHYHLLFALEQFGLADGEVEVVDMQAADMVAAFAEGRIDGGFVWDPALAAMKRRGRVLIDSGVLSDWGRPTFDGLVVDRAWGRAHAAFMRNFVRVLEVGNADYREGPEAWTVGSERVDAMVALSGCDAAAAVETLALYGFPTLAEQASARWLGGGAEGGAVRGLAHAARFLERVGGVGGVPGGFADFVTDRYVLAAMR